ncbi:MAG: chemotaxis protein CheW [Bacteroidota bacterium]
MTRVKHNSPGRSQGTTIDWDDIKRKVASLQTVIEQKDIHLPEETRDLLKQRARVLALKDDHEIVQQEHREIIVFRLGGETYGIETEFVREVYPLKDYTALPGTPSFVLGIMNVRGQIVSVIDLRKFFGLPEKGLGELNKVIILSSDRMEFGILTDVVEGTVSVVLKDVVEVPPGVIEIGVQYLKGVTKDRVILLDAESIVNDEKMIVNEESA